MRSGGFARKSNYASRGQVLSRLGSVAASGHLAAEITVLTGDEGGRRTPFFTRYTPQFFFRTADVTGTVELAAGVDMVMPGDSVELTVDLCHAIAMEEQSRFAIREGNRTIGHGVVTRVLE